MKSDVIIIGAGPAGLSLANSLSALDINCCVIEKQPEESLAAPAYDGREIALTHFSREILQDMGVWQRFDENSIGKLKQAKVLDGDSDYALHFEHKEIYDDTLGYISSNHNIRKVLYDEAKTHDSITLMCGQSVESIETSATTAKVTLADGAQLSAALVVAADSRFSGSRQKMGISTDLRDFGKVAIVCKATHSEPHEHTAYECFRYGGTLAVLPLVGNESSIVITVASDKADAIMKQSAEDFSSDVTEQFEYRFGEMKLSSERVSYPLVGTYADKFFANRFALIGDAAVGMHPVTAHGFNLGLKGQYVLSQEIKKALLIGGDIGSDSVLSQYSSKHRKESRPLYLGTNFLVELYTDERPLHKFARKAVLHLGNRIKPAKRMIMNQLTQTKDAA